MDTLEEYAIVITNKISNWFVFWQNEGESIDNFFSSLQVLSETSNFCGRFSDSLIWYQVISGVWDHDNRQDLLKVQNMQKQYL